MIMCSKLESIKMKSVTSNFKISAWMSDKIHGNLIIIAVLSTRLYSDYTRLN